MTVAIRPKRQGALAALNLEEKAAWKEYLETVQETSESRYDEVEPWAWNRLNTKLAAIHVRRRSLLGDDA